jgi:acyl-CoA thioester hydrolase
MDAFQHVNNTVYFRFFESARIAYFERMGVSGAAGASGGVGPILHSTACRFRAPVTYPDTVRVGARVVDVGDDRFRMEYAVVSEALGRVAATGDGLVVTFDYGAGTKVSLPAAWRRGIEAVEAGTP